ncbi:MAG TPA: ABC transporter permease [Firmicutes bacterium]|nr:ABC transporter permease [Candidatus Fermentithermobacillaceae bacterium]
MAYSSQKQAVAGLVILLLVVAVAFLAPYISPYDPNYLGDTLMEAPGRQHLLGTDGMGRDVFSMILHGTRVSLLVGVISALLSGMIGTLVGGISGFFGGTVDAVISEIIDIFLMLPTFFLILIIVAMFGSSMLNVMIVIGLTSWPGNARLMRAQALSLRERTFVIGAKVIGESRGSILFRYIIPNGIFPIIANTTMQVASAILTEAGLSFLGLGDPNVVSWGRLIYDGRAYLTSAWWISTFAGLAIVVTVMAFYLIGDGLNRVLNPKLRDERQ